MARIQRTQENLFERPKGSFIVGNRYVYVNTTTRYIPGDKEKGTRGHTDHDSLCIGVLQNPDDKSSRMFYANKNYKSWANSDELPDPPKLSDSVAIGLQAFVDKASETAGLSSLLARVFGAEDAAQILDLASYMMSQESAVMQHYPAWARKHAIFSEKIRSDTSIGSFLKDNLSFSKMDLFRQEWLKANIGSGLVYLCYDSTNVNSQADGVFFVQRGKAKDEPDKLQVNTDYVIRQDDGLPLTYLHSPGSVPDISQAQEMISFIDKTSALTGKQIELCLICDRGYISGKNLRQMDDAHIRYLLMLRSDMARYCEIADQCVDSIRSYRNLLETPDDKELYGMTVKCDELYKNGPECYAQVLWSGERYNNKRKEAIAVIDNERKEVEKLVNESTGRSFNEKDLKKLMKQVPAYFELMLEPGEPEIVIQKKRGRGEGTKEVSRPTSRIIGYQENATAIDREIMKAGIIVMVSKDEMTAQEAEDRYHKRDCVEKAFEALKSHLGMDKIGVTTEEAMHGKGCIWFVASILHALLFNGTAELRVRDRKSYTTPRMIDYLEAIEADRDLNTGKYKRRYKLTKKQSSILACYDTDEAAIDELITVLG